MHNPIDDQNEADKNTPQSTLRDELNSKKSTIQDIMKNLGGLNDDEINKEFTKIDKQLNRRDIYINGYQDSTKKPEYNNADYLLNGKNVGKLVSANAKQGGEGSMDYIFNFKFDKGESNECPYKRSNDIIVPIIN